MSSSQSEIEEIHLPESKTKADAFAALYNKAKPLRMGYHHPNCHGPAITSELKALQKLYAQCRPTVNSKYYCDYVDGRPLKVSFSLSPKLNIKTYNQFHGNNAAQKALSSAKPLIPLQDPSLRQAAENNPCVLFDHNIMKAYDFTEKEPELLIMFDRCKSINLQQVAIDEISKKIENGTDRITKCEANYTFLSRPIGIVEHRGVDCRKAFEHIQRFSNDSINTTIGDFSLTLYKNYFRKETQKFSGELSVQQATQVLSAANGKP